MTSVFDTPAPSFSIKDAEKIALDHFDISGSAELLVSDRDQNFLVKSTNETFVLKISNSMEHFDVLDMQNKAMQHIHQNNPDIELTFPIVSKAGKKIFQIEKNKIFYQVRLLKYIEGKFLNELKYDSNLLFDLGKFLACIDIALNGFDHVAAHRAFVWNARCTNELYAQIDQNKTDQKMINHYLDLYNSNVLINDQHLAKLVIHNDGNDHNILVNPNGKINGIIDFGDMIYSYRVLEPAVSMAYVAIEKENPLPLIGSLLKGYNKIIPLNIYELKSVVYLMCLRLCISISMSTYRKKLFPKNKYLVISESKARKFLINMLDDDITRWESELTEYVYS